MKAMGNKKATIFLFTFPDCKNEMVLVHVPKVEANLLIPNACTGENPTNRRDGIIMRPPPPTTESIKEAIQNKMDLSNKKNVDFLQ